MNTNPSVPMPANVTGWNWSASDNELWYAFRAQEDERRRELQQARLKAHDEGLRQGVTMNDSTREYMKQEFHKKDIEQQQKARTGNGRKQGK